MIIKSACKMRMSLVLAIAVLVVYLSYSEAWKPRRRPWRRPRIPWRRPRGWPRFPRYRVRTGRDVADSSDSNPSEMRDATDEREAALGKVIEALQTLAERSQSDREQEQQ